MKVLHIVTSLDFGGVERHMEVISSTLFDAHLDHIFVAIGSGGAVERKLQDGGFAVYCLNKPVKIPSLISIYSLTKLMKELKPCFVHCHGAEANFHGVIAARFAHVPVVVAEEIGIPSHSKKAKIIFKFIYSLADKVIGVADSVVSWLIENKEVPSHKAVRIYNPVNLPEPKEGFKEDSGLNLVFVGRLEEVKNPLGLLMAVHKLLNDSHLINLSIVGTGSQIDLLKKYVKNNNLDCNVSFYGFQSDPFKFIKNADVFIQPSLSEGLSLALVEAMACAVPAIVTPVGGSTEVVLHGKTGWIAKSSSTNDIAEAILDAINVPKYYLHSMGLAARQSVLEPFNPINYIKTLEKLYLDIQGKNES